ncbi:hypothetical protein IMG5_164230, partial [Ichthyophthirius multifiliis]
TSGAFCSVLLKLYEELYKQKFPSQNIQFFGKPFKQSFQLAYNYAIQQIDQNKFVPGEVYMIGDNINMDLIQAKELGWKTVFV